MNGYQIASGLGALLLAGALTAAAQTNPSDAAASDAKPKAKADGLFPDEVVAKAKGFEIRRRELDEAVLIIKRSLAAQNRTLTAEESAKAERQVLDRLIQVQLLLQKATDADKAKAKELADKLVDEAKARSTSEESFKRQFLVSGLDEVKLRAKLAEEATAEQVLERELKVAVTDDQVRKYYDDNPSKFEQPEMVRAAHVLIANRDMQANLELSEDQKKAKRKTELMGGWPVSSTFETAKEVLRKAKEGADFAKLAKDYSDDPGSKDKGGECTFPRGQMVPRFEAAAFALKTNEISDIIETPFGYHIIKCYERIPAKKVELAKVSTDLKNYLTLKKIRSEGQVEILDNNPKMTELPAPAPSSRGLEALAAGRRHISQPAPAPGSSVPESPLPEAPLPRASQIAERPCEVVCEVCGTIIYGVPYEDACNLRDSHQKYATDQAVREDGATAQKHISTALEIRYRSGGP